MFSNSEMHLITQVFLLLELMMFTYQAWYYFSWPKDKNRLWYLILLALLIIYNLTGGLFPDPKISWISIRLQNIIAYGSGFFVGSYIPYYFYKSFDIEKLRFHALYGVPTFLILPYVISLVVFYAINGNLDKAIMYGMILPFFYSLVILWAILKAIQYKFKEKQAACQSSMGSEMLVVYCAVVPWASMSVLSFIGASQSVEAVISNSGFVVVTIMFMIKSGRDARMEHHSLMKLTKMQQADFNRQCSLHGLTKREAEIAALYCQGLIYRDIANALFISKNTVDTHVQNIFLKTGANKRIELLQQLGNQN